MLSPEETIIVLLVLLIFSVVSYKKKSLDFQGVLVGNILGISVFLLGGIQAFSVLVIFFAVAEIATALESRRKGTKTEIRSIQNIIGNGLPALLCLFLNLPFAFFGAISAALADTMSSEIGILSKKRPLLITSLKPVKKGTDGGITLQGYLAALAGALIISIVFFYFSQNIGKAGILIIAGLGGSTIDSVLGATLERKKILNNTSVNFLGSGTGAVIAFALGLFF